MPLANKAWMRRILQMGEIQLVGSMSRTPNGASQTDQPAALKREIRVIRSATTRLRLSLASTIRLALSVLIIVAVSACETTVSTPTGEIDAQPIYSAPYRLDYGGRPVVSVMVNGEGPYDYILDTASSQSAVFANLVNNANLPRTTEDRTRVFSLNGVERQPSTVLRELSFGPIKRTNFSSVVFQNWLNQPKTPQGLLGVDILANAFILVDPARMVIEIYDADNPPSLTAIGWRRSRLFERDFGASSRPLYSASGRMNRRRFPILIDTGSEVSLSNLPFVDIIKPDLPAIRFIRTGTRIRDANDEAAKFYEVRFNEMRSGGILWEEGRIFATNARLFNDLGYARTPFLLAGFDLLSKRPFALDFKNLYLYVSPGPVIEPPPGANSEQPADFGPELNG